MTNTWRDSVLGPAATVRDVMQVLDQGSLHFVMVAGPDGVLQGTVTDGDVRRALLRGLSTSTSIAEVMNTRPVVVTDGASRAEALRVMQARKIRQIPVVDGGGRITRVEVLDQLIQPAAHGHAAVIMAGGRGLRLRPLTEALPKPLLPVGGRPAIEHVIEGLVASGFREIVICVNYFADMIIERLGDGSRWGIAVSYVREQEYLGTAGALAHLQPRPSMPFLVINADVLTRFDFRLLLDFHASTGAIATMCVRTLPVQVPYGVIWSDGQRLTGIEEKPVQTYLINAGIYLLDPVVLAEVPSGQPFDMTTLFAKLAAGTKAAHVFPLHEYWMDIGQMDDLQKANADFSDGE